MPMSLAGIPHRHGLGEGSNVSDNGNGNGNEKIKGFVKWFNNQKGYGFIILNEESPDIFVHHTAITMEGYRTLREGEEVVFDLMDSPKGLQAVNVKPVIA
ncbi:MAG: hypothetical protein AMXMBFR84_32830 [Candidatus Hydrogenedentota bacterium]